MLFEITLYIFEFEDLKTSTYSMLHDESNIEKENVILRVWNILFSLFIWLNKL